MASKQTTYDTATNKQPDTYTCNVLPVYINYTGKISTSSEFWNNELTRTITTKTIDNSSVDTKNGNEKKLVTSYLRGRKLLGVERELHNQDQQQEQNLTGLANYNLHLFERIDDNAGGGASDHVEFSSIGKCHSLVNFDHERLPLENDPVEKLNEWVVLSNAIHDDDEDGSL